MVFDKTKNFTSIFSYELKNIEGKLVSFNGQSISFRLSSEEVYFFQMPMTLMKSRYQTQFKPKTQKIKLEKEVNTFSLPPSLHLFKLKILSRNGFIVNK